MRNVLVDQAILACCKPRFMKVARIVYDAAVALKLPRGRNVDFTAERIKALVKAKKLPSKGNLDQWGFSEICLPESASSLHEEEKGK
ncbi:MAG TPA: DUF3658 domain-containing protein [Bradyrhizobium sp.]